MKFEQINAPRFQPASLVLLFFFAIQAIAVVMQSFRPSKR